MNFFLKEKKNYFDETIVTNFVSIISLSINALEKSFNFFM